MPPIPGSLFFHLECRADRIFLPCCFAPSCRCCRSTISVGAAMVSEGWRAAGESRRGPRSEVGVEAPWDEGRVDGVRR